MEQYFLKSRINLRLAGVDIVKDFSNQRDH